MSGTRGESKAELALRDYGLSFPEVTEEFPWGHRTLKVKKKAFVFMGNDESGFGLSVKLPESGQAALLLPFAEPTGYGLGKSGWVSAKFPPKAEVPVELLKKWLLESYRAVAPKKLAAQVEGGAAAPATKRKAPARRSRA
ncbi:MAG: MmcQ/YjbR family DNA-binding protein [Myxococcaceae bacterium]